MAALLYLKPQNEQDWESWCQILFARVLGLSHAQKFQVRGTKQKGIDLLGVREDGAAFAVQCKLRNTRQALTEAEAAADVEKAKLLDCRLAELVIATTHDAKGLQGWAARVTAEHAKIGLFRVTVYAWPDICDLFNQHPDIARECNPQLSHGPPTAPASNLPALSGNIVPRPAVTAAIHAMLSADGTPGAVRAASAWAGGGYGKTVAALLYAHEHAGFYTGGRFFLGVEGTDFTASLDSLRAHFDVPEEAKPHEAAAIVKQRLESGGPALLILDNVADAEHWARIRATGLVPGGDCRVLITTRRELLPGAREVRIERLTNEEAREVYRRFSLPEREAPDDETADAITAWLEGLAVAVAAVGARMRLRPGLGWAEYWANLQRLTVDDLPDADPAVRAQLGADHRGLEGHRRTLRVIEDALAALDAPERRAAAYAALLPADLVPAPWLELLLGADALRPPGPLKVELQGAPDEPPRTPGEVVEHLHRLDVLRAVGEEGKLLSLHRMWRERVNGEAGVRGDERGEMLDAVGRLGVSRAKFLWEGWVHHAARWEITPLTALARVLGEAGSIWHWVWLANAAVSPLRDLGRFVEARALLEQTMVDESRLVDEIGQTEFAAVLINLAILHQDLDDPIGAKSLMDRAIAIYESANVKDDRVWAAAYSNLGAILRDLGDFVGAKVLMQQTIAIDERRYGKDHSKLAARYSNLATILRRLGDLTEARSLMERAIVIDERRFGTGHPTLAVRYSNLALILQQMRDLTGAKTLMERAILIDEKALPENHPNLATRYNNLAFIEEEMGRIADAVELWKRAYSIQFKAFGAGHRHTKITFNSLTKYGHTPTP